MSAPSKGLTFFGTIRLELAGAEYSFVSAPDAPSELREDGIVFSAAAFVDKAPWSALREIHGWSPVAAEDR